MSHVCRLSMDRDHIGSVALNEGLVGKVVEPAVSRLIKSISLAGQRVSSAVQAHLPRPAGSRFYETRYRHPALSATGQSAAPGRQSAWQSRPREPGCVAAFGIHALHQILQLVLWLPSSIRVRQFEWAANVPLARTPLLEQSEIEPRLSPPLTPAAPVAAEAKSRSLCRR